MGTRTNLTIKDSNSPFFVTTQKGTIGLDFKNVQRKQFDAPPVYHKPVEKTVDYSFMYSRSSDIIGDQVPRSDSRLSVALDRHVKPTALARLDRINKQALNTSAEGGPSSEGGGDAIDEESARQAQPQLADPRMATRFDYAPRTQHPVYRTTNNDIGKESHMGLDRLAWNPLSNSFTHSFNGVRFRDQGLNTFTTRSRVHKELDARVSGV